MTPMNRFLSWLAIATSSAFFVACGGDDAPATDTPAARTATVTGRIVETDTDEPLAGARVTSGSRSTTTANDGTFTLQGVTPSERALVKAEAAGHGPNSAFVALPADGTAEVNVRLIKLAPATTFDAATAATLTTPGSNAQVQLPAAALVDATTGTAATGTITASLTDIDPASDPERMPGNFTTLQAGAVRTIESFGAVKVDLRDAAGNRLNLAAGKTATVRIPLSTRSPNPPATVPLFHFDEATGRWVEEGSATLKTGDGEPYYEGTVSHFSYWNADMVAETVELEGCVVDGNGRPVSGVQVSSSGIDYSGRSTAFTNAEGRFTIQVRKNATTGVWGATKDRITAINEVEIEEFGGAMTGCMVLEAATSPIPGKLAPKVMQSPRNTTVQAGEAAMFSAVIEGTQPMTYSWTRNGEPVPNSNTSILFVYPVASSDDGAVYKVTVKNVAGEIASNTAVLTVTTTAVAPQIQLQPLPVAVTASQNAVFAVTANGSGPLAYQWKRNGADIAGATAAVLTFAATDADHGATYSVTVSNASGQVTSNGATLTVVPANAAPAIQVPPASAVVDHGESVTFGVTAQGSGMLTYQWQRNGVNIAGATSATYTIDEVSAADHQASFRVVVTNAIGSTTSAAAVLSVNTGAVDQKDRILKLLGHWAAGLTAAGAPLEIADDDFKVKPLATVCETGTVAPTLDGAAPTTGQVLPLGNHTLAATFTACETGGATYDGRTSIAYQFADTAHRNGVAQSTVTDFVHTGTDFVGDDTAVRANGQARIELDGSLVGTTETIQLRFIPAAGFTLADVGTGVASSAVSGNALLHNVLVSDAMTLTRQEFAAYTFTRGGVTYVLDGFVQFEFTSPMSIVGSGTVTLKANGVEVARITATATGYGVEVLNGGVPASAGYLSAASGERVSARSKVSAVKVTLQRRR